MRHIKKYTEYMRCTLVIKYCKQNWEIIEDEVQLEVCKNLRTLKIIRLNIINELGDNIIFYDIIELLEKLEQCNTETLEFNGFKDDILEILLGN